MITLNVIGSASSPFYRMGYDLASTVFHPDYDKGRWTVLIERVGERRLKRVCANKTTAEAWCKYLRRQYGDPFESNVLLSIMRTDPVNKEEKTE